VQRSFRIFFIALVSVVLFAGAGAQSASPASTPSTDPQFGPERNAQRDPDEVKREKDRLKAIKKDSFASVKKDTDKLLALATELKQSVDQASEDKLSLEVIRKTEEIERLSKKVRDKMKSL
jgi:hypothetical protein